MNEAILNRIPLVKQFAKFAVVGGINTLIDFIVLNVEMSLTGITSGPYMYILNSISFSVATVNSYFMNKHWTFEDRTRQQEGTKFSQFLAVSIVGVIINSTVVFLITSYTSPMFGLSDQLWANVAKLMATAISLIWNFVGYKIWVFKK